MSFPDAEYAFRPSLPREAVAPISKKRKSVSWEEGVKEEAPSRVPNLFLQRVVSAPVDVPARGGLYRLVEEPPIKSPSRAYPAPALKKIAPPDRAEELRDRKYKLIIAIHEAQIALAKCQWRRDEAGAMKVNEELVRLTALSKKNNEALQSLRGAL